MAEVSVEASSQPSGSHHLLRQAGRVARVAYELTQSSTPLIDEQFMAMAEKVASQPESLFTVISKDLLDPLPPLRRPAAICHDKTLLGPNPYRNELAITLGYLDMMLADQVPQLQEAFSEQLRQLDVFDRIVPSHNQPGEKFIVVSNHLQLPDQGFSLGLTHKAAQEHGLPGIEHHLVAVIGRLIGYFEFDHKNVVDGVLRKVGSVLKTFPSGGSESLNAESAALALFRAYCNRHTRQEFTDLIGSDEGKIVFMAPSGEQDKPSDDKRSVNMAGFGKATCQMLVEACDRGATILPVFVDFWFDQSVVKFAQPVNVKSPRQAHRIGGLIADTGNQALKEAAASHPDIDRFKRRITYDQLGASY